MPRLLYVLVVSPELSDLAADSTLAFRRRGEGTGEKLIMSLTTSDMKTLFFTLSISLTLSRLSSH
jgi:hypothetical protein